MHARCQHVRANHWSAKTAVAPRPTTAVPSTRRLEISSAPKRNPIARCSVRGATNKSVPRGEVIKRGLCAAERSMASDGRVVGDDRGLRRRRARPTVHTSCIPSPDASRLARGVVPPSGAACAPRRGALSRARVIHARPESSVSKQLEPSPATIMATAAGACRAPVDASMNSLLHMIVLAGRLIRFVVRQRTADWRRADQVIADSAVH